jgi:hypothetical protein
MVEEDRRERRMGSSNINTCVVRSMLQVIASSFWPSVEGMERNKVPACSIWTVLL